MNLAIGPQQGEAVLTGSGVLDRDAPWDADFAVYGESGPAEYEGPDYVAQFCWEGEKW